MGVNLGTAYGEIQIGTEGAEKNIASLSQKMQETGKALSVGVTAPLVGAAAAAIKFSNDFNSGMANVASLGVATDRVVELKGALQEMAVETGKTTDDLSGGLYQVVSAFGDTADTASILEINAKAAAAGLASTTEAIDLTSAVTKGYGDTSAAAVQKAADLAQQTVILGQTTFPELAGSLGKVVPLASALGVTQEELFAQMATLTGVTGNAAEVSTQLRASYQALLAPSADMATSINEVATSLEMQGNLAGGELVDNWRDARTEYMATSKEMGDLQQKIINTTKGSAEYKKLAKQLTEVTKAYKDQGEAVDGAAAALGPAIVDSVGLTDTLGLLSATAGGNTDQLSSMFGSVEALNAVLALSGPQADIYKDKLAAMGGASGVVDKAFLAQTQGINAAGFSMQQLSIRATVIMQKLGDGLAPALGVVLQQLAPLADAAIDLADQFAKADAGTQTMIVAALGLAAALGPIMMALPAIGTALAAIVSPIGLVVLGVAALGAAWSLNLGGIQDITTQAWAAIQPALQGLYDIIVLQSEPMGDWSLWWETMTTTLGEPAATAIHDTAGFLVDLKSALTNMVEVLADAGAGSIEAEEALRLFPAALQPIISGALDLWIRFAALAGTMQAFLKPAFDAVIAAIVNLPTTLGTLATNAGTLWDKFVGLAGTIGETLKPAFDGIVAAVLNFPETLGTLATNAGTLWDKFAGLAGTIGETLKPAFDGIATALGNLPTTFSTLATNTGSLWTEFDRVAKVIADFFAPAFERVATATTGLPEALAPLLPKLQEMGTAFSGMVTALQPFLALIGVGLVIAVQFGVNAFAAIIQRLPGIVGPIIDQVTASVKLITTVLTEVVALVKAVIAGDWTAVWASAKTIFAAFADFFRGTIVRFSTLATTIFQAIYDAVVNTLTDLGVDITPLLDGILSTWEKIWTAAKDALAPVTEAIGAVQTKIAEFQSWISGITFSNPFQPLADAAGTAMDAAGKFFGGGGNAVGTSYSGGGATLVGERGPEMVVMPTGARVLTNGQTNNLGSSSGTTINVNLSGVKIGNDMDLQRIGYGLANQIAAALG